MGIYLSSPCKEKFSSDESNDKLVCGTSSMQGWRLNQEDAHNCILDYDANTAFFAVYDGHGGHEVAEYCSKNLPDYIKQTEAYKKEDIKNALIDGFLGFDATLTTPDVIEELKKIAQEKEAEEVSDDEEENVDHLYEEAAMPIEKVIEKYAGKIYPEMRNIDKDSDKSPSQKNKSSENDNDVGTSGNSVTSAGSSGSSEGFGDGVSSSNNEENEAKCVEQKTQDEKPPTEKNGSNSAEDKTIPVPDSSDAKESSEADVKKDDKPEEPVQNGDASSPEDVTSSSPSQENGDISKKGKGKMPLKRKTPKPAKERPKRNATQLYKKILNFAENEESEEDSEDEEDKTFSVPNEEVSSDEDGDGLDTTIEGENSDATSEEDEAEEEEDEDEEDSEEELNDDMDNVKEEPGSDSGCTAVVAILRGNELYVANAGDSRCIVCRNGEAVEMSFDHKPENPEETQRIKNAGGRVTWDGRVNNGLNLSRAIGDHSYKQNKELSDREQMITALPDIKTLTIKPTEDEFMVLACDGIWNCMTNQEVVDFVRTRITEGREKLSQICEEMFEHCLAPHSHCDGTGCDNMTAIIVQFKSTLLKRSAASDDEPSSNSKMAKTENNESQIDTTV